MRSKYLFLSGRAGRACGLCLGRFDRTLDVGESDKHAYPAIHRPEQPGLYEPYPKWSSQAFKAVFDGAPAAGWSDVEVPAIFPRDIVIAQIGEASRPFYILDLNHGPWLQVHHLGRRFVLAIPRLAHRQRMSRPFGV